MTLELLSETYQTAIQELANDPQVSVTSGVDYPCTPELIQEWLSHNQRKPPEELYFALLVQGQPVGGCALRHIDSETRSAYLGYWIGRRFWGQGFGSQGARLLRDYAFTHLELNLLHALCLYGSNANSTRILQKIGFVPDEFKADRVASGRWGDAFPGDVWRFYVLTRQRWLTLPK